LQKGIDQLLKFILPLVVLLLIVSLFMVLTYMVHKPIRKVEKLLSGLLKGEKQEYPRIKQNPMLDHILQMLNSLEKRSEAISVFVKRIGSGNFELEHDHFEADDRLGKSLVEMSDKLMEIEQTALVQQEEEQKQNWIGSGIAQLNEILRDSSSDIETLTQNVLSFIVNYADMIQGAIYITSEESESESESGSLFLKLQAAYAYQQTRYIDKKFKIGEGPVGACAAEQSQIILSNIPADHLKIVSGLGSHTPFQILFEPLLMNNVLFGVLEISSLSEIPAYTIELITRSSGSLASAMANVRSSAKLKNLLREYEKTSARLSEQEETMRVNFENMLATQEASMHREREVTALFNSIDISIIRLEVNTGGMILNINHKFLEITGQLNEEVIGKQITAFVAFDSRDEVNTALQLCTNLESYSCELKFLGKFSIQTRARVVFSPIVDQDYAVPKIHIFGMTIQKEMVEG
jgi:PAS domain-containing protein